MRLEGVSLNEKAKKRIEELRETVLCSIPIICIDRAKVYTEIYQSNEFLPPITKRALAFSEFLEKVPVYINKNELIVGSEGPVSGSVQVFPEVSSDWIEKELDLFETRPIHSKFLISEEDKETLRNLLPYWRGKTVKDRAMALFPDDLKLSMKVGVFASVSGLILGLGHLVPDYEKILNLGLNNIIKKIENKKNLLDATNPSDLIQIYFYDAAQKTCQAVVRFAERYSESAKKLAESETDPERKEELLKIASICSKVPAQPAKTFHEALQSFWFVHLAILLESNGTGISPGRFDQYMYKFLANDIKDKIIDYSEALELIEHLWIKFNEVNKLMDCNLTDLIQSYPSRQNIVLGGLTEEGLDATNELSILCLKATSDIKFPQPSLSVRYHMNSPDDFMIDVAKVIRLGIGLPALYNDEAHIPALMNRGVTLKDARNYALVGCVEPTPAGKSFPNAAGSKFNLVKCLELALYGGEDPVTGKKVGLETEKNFLSFDDLLNAYKKQVQHFVRKMVLAENIIENAHKELTPLPWLSVMTGGCLEKGKEVLEGGAKYNFTGPQGVGLATVADSLAAIKKLVFENSQTTIEELKQKLKENFESDERYRQMLINLSPKYGNDDDYVDLLAREVMDIFAAEVEKFSNTRGGQFHAGMFPASANVSLGRVVGATPDGRRYGEPLPDGISPVQGRDTSGMTAVFNSVSKLNHLRTSNGTLLNQKLHPLTLSTDEGLRKLVSAIRAYFSKRAMHVQFNVVSSEILKDAQRNPEKYQGLVVRVSGWSAFWVTIDKALQDDIISRSEQVI